MALFSEAIGVLAARGMLSSSLIFLFLAAGFFVFCSTGLSSFLNSSSSSSSSSLTTAAGALRLDVTTFFVSSSSTLASTLTFPTPFNFAVAVTFFRTRVAWTWFVSSSSSTGCWVLALRGRLRTILNRHSFGTLLPCRSRCIVAPLRTSQRQWVAIGRNGSRRGCHGSKRVSRLTRYARHHVRLFFN